MKASPKDGEDRHHDDDGGGDRSDNGRGLKRRRLHAHTKTMVGGHHYRHHRKHPQCRDDDNASISFADIYGGNSTSSSSSSSSTSSSVGGEDANDNGTSAATPVAGHPELQLPQPPHPAEGGAAFSLQAPRHNRKVTVVNNNNCNYEGDCMSLAIRNTGQQPATNNDKITLSLSTHSEEENNSENNKIIHEPIISFNLAENPIESATVNEKPQPVGNTDFDGPTITANDCMNGETSNDDCLSQSPLNLTRSQGSSEEGGTKSEEDEYDVENEEKNGFSNAINDDENIINGHNLPTETPFPWNTTLGNYNKQKQQHPDDKITASPPQLLLTSGQLTTGCLQAAQLLIPTARGIMTQTILAIPINDMVSSAITTPTVNQQQLQQQLLYHSSSNVRQKNIRQQLNQTYQPSLSLPLNRYFQQQTTVDDTTTTTSTATDNANIDNNNYDPCMLNNGTVGIDQYNNNQRRKWQSPDLTNVRHNYLSPQQKLLHRTKNEECGESMNVQRSNESHMIQTPAGANGDVRIYSTNNAASIITAATPMSPAHGRNSNANNGGADVIQRQTVWPTAITAIDQHTGGDENDNEDTKQSLQNQPAHVVSPTPLTSSANINSLKSLAPPSSQLNCHMKQSKDDDPASAAAAAAAAYNQQNAICTALATHMLCASQLAAAQQPMFDGMDNGGGVKKANHVYNNNNNNNVKTNNMMGVVNPAVLEKWMMEERYYYNNNNNNGKNIGGGHNQHHHHHQRYNVAAAAAVELLSGGGGGGGGISASSSGGGDSLASCKKRKRRTSFTPHALELLNGHFERNTHPSGSEITGLAHRLGYEREVIRIWFCNKRQALKNTVRTINGSGPTHMTSTKSHNNTSGY
ncbi:probable serine/threonine-protein kinase DDB_G0282963 isoform X2 [Sipha flava]|uniref:Probable serine/threonine-protein kinase DDB_G0282963 isoform X2 n=1 Tax=Sipha flava TaxID=143950 RepID=A0A8B8GTN8_9HEMI|nr:probable serine/threonine-protein kinase DDB_G0282963 isoform X2 [Sipha flava]